MLVGTIRPADATTADVGAHSLAEAHEALRAASPDGFELVKASVRMSSGTTLLAAAGEFSRRDGAKEIEAPDMEAMRAAVPEGWMLLHVRRG